MSSDSVRITNLPDSGSKERVAFDLAIRIWNVETGGQEIREYKPTMRKVMLDLYAECLLAAQGDREISPT